MTLTSPLALERRDDAGLLTSVANGDSRAIVNLYHEHARDLFRFIARRMDGPVEDVEEILQDTMLAAVSAAGKFRGDCSVRTWLCGIARNQIMQRRRTDLRKKRIPSSCTVSADENTIDYLQQSSVDGYLLPMDLAESLAMKETVRQIMDQLEPDYREALMLRYVDEFSIREIARICNKSERAVEGLLRRARLRAKEIGAQYL
ncbi:MAG TPA: RNA polymerase sigma factor [Armatimonadota bacterium]|nr:RNA polymerase sigma factor [Armatimonadota bacterium]